MVYVDRLRRANPQYFVETSPEDLYLSALIVAGKFLQDGGLDEYIWNDEWAQCSSRTIQRVNELELELLCRIDWNLHVGEQDFKDAVESAEQWIALSSLKKHQFLTYNDLTVLSQKWDATWKQIKILFTYTGAISATYLGTLYLALLCATFHQTNLINDATSLSSQAMATNETTTTSSALSTSSYNQIEDFDDLILSNESIIPAAVNANDSCSNDSIIQKPAIPNFVKLLVQRPLVVHNAFENIDRWKEIECY